MKNNYLIECSDTVSLNNYIEKIVKEADFTGAYTSVYDLEEDEITSVLNDLITYGLFSDKKVIIVKNIFSYSDKEKLNEILKYIDNYNPDNLLILVSKKIDNRISIVKKIKENSNIKFITIEIDPYNYTKELLKDYKISDKNIKLITYLCKDDITKIYNECQKLAIYYEKESEISEDIIKELITEKLSDNTDTLFSLIKHTIEKNKKLAFKEYQELKRYGVDANSIIGLMTSQLRLLYQVKYLDSKKTSAADIIKTLNLKNTYQLNKIRENIYNYTYEELNQVIKFLADLDLSIKNGHTSSDIAIDLLLINL